MARGINQIQDIFPIILRPVSKADRRALMVIPRSLSKSMESRTWATIFLALTAPVYSNNRSARVDFPWSIWAMIQKFRIRAWSMKTSSLSGTMMIVPALAGLLYKINQKMNLDNLNKSPKIPMSPCAHGTLRQRNDYSIFP